MRRNLTELIPEGLPFSYLYHLFHLNTSKVCKKRHDLFQKVQFTLPRHPILASTLAKNKQTSRKGDDSEKRVSVGIDSKWVRLKLN